jgi:nucleoside-diphosphate-sugar epimerase
MRRLLITGASGFIGRPTVSAFAGGRYTVRASVRQPPQAPFAAGVEVVEHQDLSQPFDWRPLLDGVDAVIHLAGISHIGRRAAPELYDRVNHQATAQLARAAAESGVKHFVLMSSIRAQSGPAADHALNESDAGAPSDAYGRSKLAAEGAVRSAGVPFTILRPVLVYGRGVRGNFAFLLRAADSRWPLAMKNFNNRRSLLGIDNLVSAMNFVLTTPATIGETYIVADPGMPPRMSDVFSTLRKAQGRWSLLLPMPMEYVELPLRLIGRNDIWDRLGSNLRVDVGRLIAAGWRPLHDTREGLAALAQQMRSRNSTVTPPCVPPTPDRPPP